MIDIIRRRRGLLLLALPGLFWPLASLAEEEWPAPIQALEKQGLTVHERFEAPAGLTGYAASVQGREVAVYVTEDGQHAIVGTLLDAEGNDLSAAPLAKLVGGPQDAALWQKLEESTWISDGDPAAEHVLYTFTDPNCPYCHRFFEQTRPWVEAGKVQLRHIMVGILKKDSPQKAIALLAADDPTQALREHQQGEEVEIPDTLSREQEDELFANNQLMRSLGFGATPTTLYHTGENDRLAVTQGAPGEEKLVEMMGSPRP
ncbi:thiol:disulfide interchange protein DsbG [Modicisalibacter ilicicola DSM 19980]|uniref:Thiol:disulfide interchange protein n=1 Tax=Modicisalibacter ilicicola DSM 19980 TaxID=1121942 RepID=A0A1M4WAZ1_9GAMM|nr:thiol:disulfide interchange protein DsbG [Halomonas ilicicola]SHE78438.1 thiol:disulfide interchange protein DsbG [Halomonas ilicicola DSM 19980]